MIRVDVSADRRGVGKTRVALDLFHGRPDARLIVRNPQQRHQPGITDSERHRVVALEHADEALRGLPINTLVIYDVA